jgi:hypothetical protein
MLKKTIDSLDENLCEPLTLATYLNRYQINQSRLAYEIQNNLVLACYNWKNLRISPEYEVRWHIPIYEVDLTELNGEEVEIRTFNSGEQQYTYECTQTNTDYSNLINLQSSVAIKLIAGESDYVTVMDGMTIKPFGEYFSICHKLWENKWFQAPISLGELKLIRLNAHQSNSQNYATDNSMTALEKHEVKVLSCLRTLLEQGEFTNLMDIPLGIKPKIIKHLESYGKNNEQHSGEDSVKKAWTELSKKNVIRIRNKNSFKR